MVGRIVMGFGLVVTVLLAACGSDDADTGNRASCHDSSSDCG